MSYKVRDLKKKGYHIGMTGPYDQEEIQSLCYGIIRNRAFITKEEIKVLEFLSRKGSFEKTKVILVDEDFIERVKLKDMLSTMKTHNKYNELDIISK